MGQQLIVNSQQLDKKFIIFMHTYLSNMIFANGFFRLHTFSPALYHHIKDRYKGNSQKGRSHHSTKHNCA